MKPTHSISLAMNLQPIFYGIQDSCQCHNLGQFPQMNVLLHMYTITPVNLDQK